MSVVTEPLELITAVIPTTTVVPTTVVVPITTANSSYDQWVTELYQQLKPLAVTLPKLQLPRPITGRIGSKITKWDNFRDMCSRIQRDPQQVADYIAAELCTTTSLTDKKEMKIQYRLGPDKACAIFSKYMNTWVRCKICKGLHTTLSRHTTGRYFVIHCESCLTDHSVV